MICPAKFQEHFRSRSTPLRKPPPSGTGRRRGGRGRDRGPRSGGLALGGDHCLPVRIGGLAAAGVPDRRWGNRRQVPATSLIVSKGYEGEEDGTTPSGPSNTARLWLEWRSVITRKPTGSKPPSISWTKPKEIARRRRFFQAERHQPPVDEAYSSTGGLRHSARHLKKGKVASLRCAQECRPKP